MQNVLFSTAFPTAASGRVEFYDLCIVHLEITGRRVSFVREVHGWWDNDAGRPIFDESSTTQTKAFTTGAEALESFRAQRLSRVKGGFRYAFIWHPVNGSPVTKCFEEASPEFDKVA